MEDWDLEPGDTTTRAEIQKRFGGATQGGIEPSRSTPNIFVYTDPESGMSHGYKFDGWIDGKSVFLYTGQGKVGDQQYRGRNLSLLNHHKQQLAVRLFSAEGNAPGSQAKRQIYLGQFQVDPDNSHFEADAPDDNDDNRTVIVFRLKPIGQHFRRPKEESERDGNLGQPFSATPTAVPIEASHASSFVMGASESRVGRKREADLVNRYVRTLESEGCQVSGYHIPVSDQPYPLRVDIYDHTNRDVIEAKSSSSREHVRTAIGQLLDYQRYLDHERLTVLLPKRPREDLLDLLRSVGIDCVFETSNGDFERQSSD